MGKLFYLMGKSAVGKDHIFERLLCYPGLDLKRMVPYTTRPMRENECDGREYHFTDENMLERFRKDGVLIEERVYQTVHGPWIYYTVDDGSLQPEGQNCLAIGTPVSFLKIREYYGSVVVPVYIESEDRDRLLRAIKREGKEAVPDYREVCRRYLADEEDFSEDIISECGIKRRFRNDDIDRCTDEIAVYISESV